MTSTLVTVGIGIGLLFAGILGGYVIAQQTYSHNNMMMNNTPETTQWMLTMMNNPDMRDEMMDMMMQNQQFMQDMINNNQMMNMMNPSVMKDTGMMDSEIMNESMMSDMSFNVDAPITMPMIDGYYNGEKVFFLHTEVSDEKMANMMSMMINFPTLHVSELKETPQEDLGKIYVFTNGISGSGPWGGGPFMFQIDIFDSIPEDSDYDQLRIPHLVTWKEGVTPRILTSIDQLLKAEENGEVTIQATGNVVNAPMIVWKSNEGIEKTASIIDELFASMPDVEGEVVSVDIENYIVTMNMHQKHNMDMMNMMK